MYQTEPPRPAQESLPTMYDLPSEDPEAPGLPDEFHDIQPQLLKETFCPPGYSSDEVFIGTDLNLYFDTHHPSWYKRPDWFLVLGVARARRQEELRWSYVIWQEAVTPFLVVELLSPGTEAEDLGQTLREVNQPPTKWQVYEQILRIPYYAVYDRYENQFRLFQLVGTRYQEMVLSDQRFWFEELALGLGVWPGEYQDTVGQWLRWYDVQGIWVPTAAERADQQRQRADRLAERLRELGLDPDEV
ncbi:MAG TPA: Uma2 family endonuclease [Leptolyngbyaceae cyanobacterium M65_K2018_010]|nr:Uma2 family endonuclease [Leptolyngbyaceae cyanobacterium M65_K2018_010]